MYLKQLDVLGFKSFATKTGIHFADGVTAIVGPNGCGKTNILDAIRWVLGEQRVSLLRGSKMEEVIFNGTRDVKPLGMAEVTMTLVNDRGILPTEYMEVQITRRLFRSGESEYLLNKIPCRLKDISELFYDTGVGAHSYSVIQQEMIESVISDRAEERRFLFEEAAGITKYKQRKKAALRKLEATEHDVLRLKDIYAEVQSQVRSLKRQHRKAERYQRIADNIKNWELYLTAAKVETLQSEIDELKKQLLHLSDQRQDRETALDRVSADLECRRKEQIDLERQLADVGNQAYEATEAAYACEKEISILSEKRAAARSLLERNGKEIDGLRQREKVLEEQAAENKAEAATRGEELEALNAAVKEAESAQADADRHLFNARCAREQENHRLIELESKLSSGRTEGEGLRGQKAELTRHLSHLAADLTDKQEERNRLLQQLEGQRGSIEHLTSQRDDTARGQRELSARIEELLGRSEELSAEMSQVTASIEACEARRKLLQEMIVHYEGYESGAVAALEARTRFGGGLVGTVAELFAPAEGMETAVEGALGEMAGFVICQNRSTAEAVISFLKTENKGRIGILVPDSGTLNPVVKRPELAAPEFIGWMDSFISTRPDLRPLMEAVVARTAVFRAGHDPSDILKQLPFGFQAVSTDGLVYSKNVIAGGSDDRFPLFRRQEKVTEQQELLERLTGELDAVRQTRNRVIAEIAAERARSSQTAQKLESLDDELTEVRNQLSDQEYQLRAIDTEIARLGKERQTCQAKLDSLRSRQCTLDLDFDHLSAEKDALNRSLDDMSRQLEELESGASQALEAVSKLHIQGVECRSKLEQCQSRHTNLQELQREIASTVTAKESEIRAAEQDIAMASQRISELEIRLKDAFEHRTEISGRQSDLRDSQAELMNRIAEREGELKEVRSGRDALGEQIHQLEMRSNSCESELRATCERISEEHEVDITAVHPPCPDAELSDDQAREHLHRQREALKKFGPVNLLALQEYDTAAERERFLQEQLNDLTTAKGDLQTTIAKINSTARDLFNETFENVRRNFKRLFTDLFNGGEADVFLEDPSDPLESNIEITARPGRKRLLSISQMSGGERALTAIALLFSLYLVKQSPFCILDEIDAPLDDSNCRRFLKLIDDFSDRTQFVIITHNKITMEAADNLYGVTMEQPGISKLVAVRFAEPSDGDPTETVHLDTAVGESLAPASASIADFSERVADRRRRLEIAPDHPESE